MKGVGKNFEKLVKFPINLLHFPRIFTDLLVIFRMALNTEYLLSEAYKMCPKEIKTYILVSKKNNIF